MKGTVVLRYIGNRSEPEESLVVKALDEKILWPPSMPKEFEEAMEFHRQQMAHALKVPAFRLGLSELGKKA